MTAMLRGAITALVTPFTEDGRVDETAFGALVEWQVAEGIHGIVPVIAGAGSNDTAAAIEASRVLAKAGATHLLHVSPMYNKPPQRGILAHFRAIADASPVPVVVYNVPGRTGSNVLPETTLALAEHPNICAVKEASGNLAQIDAIIRARPADFAVLSGDDGLTLGVMASGGEGVISVVSNAVPRACAELVEAAARGDVVNARALHHRLAPLVDAAFVESNPLPIKAALAMMGRIGNHLRLPLVPMDPRHALALRAALVGAGVAL